MGALAKLFSYTHKRLANFFLEVLPDFLKLIVLGICIIWKYCRVVKANYNYMSVINERSIKFTYRRKRRKDLGECRICLSEFEEGEEGRELVECKHTFHKHCFEKWLKGYAAATCPLCRSLVVPRVTAAEYQRMRIEQENDGIEKELALILLNALHGGTCNGFSF